MYYFSKKCFSDFAIVATSPKTNSTIENAANSKNLIAFKIIAVRFKMKVQYAPRHVWIERSCQIDLRRP